jgi:putative ABC transport system substrate-binding protein
MSILLARREFIAGLGGAVAWPLAARAQQTEPVRRVGALLAGAKDDPRVQSAIAAFRERLTMLGWVERGNLRMDYRFTGGDPDRTAAYAEELVNLRPDVILAVGGPSARAVQQRTSVIPTVSIVGDPAATPLLPRRTAGCWRLGLSAPLILMRLSGSRCFTACPGWSGAPRSSQRAS